jgi:hypothetical protein
VTRWGLLLLLTFLTLGLSSLEERRALKYGVWTIVVVLAYVGVKDHAL